MQNQEKAKKFNILSYQPKVAKDLSQIWSDYGKIHDGSGLAVAVVNFYSEEEKDAEMYPEFSNFFRHVEFEF